MVTQWFRRRRAPPTPAWQLDGAEAQQQKLGKERTRRGRPPLRFCMAWTGFCLLLTFGYWMSGPKLPGSARFIGFQAFDKVDIAKAAQGTAQAENVAVNDSEINAVVGAGPSYPLDVYTPLVHNPVPLTEITVHSCFPLWIKKCKPLTRPDLDVRLGPWVLVDRPLNAGTAETKSTARTAGWALPGHDIFGMLVGAFETNYIFYRRSRRTDVPRIVDMKIVETGDDGMPLNGDDLAGWHRCSQDLRVNKLYYHSSPHPLHLYYRTIGGTKDDQVIPESESALGTGKNLKDGDPITEIDVLYGSGPMWPGFESVGEVIAANPALQRAKVTLAARRKPQSLPELPVQPAFKQDGTYKIMQIADIHFSVRHGACRDVAWDSPSKPCTGDEDTIKLVERWLDDEKPDLVVFSGDQLNGQSTSWDERSVIPKWVQPVIARKIPWASIQGNHDSQSGVLSRREQQLMLATLPYSYSRAGPAHLHDGTGGGNFYLKLKSPTPDAMHLFTLYFVDSGDYAPKDIWRPFKFTGYDWIRDDQREWIKAVSDTIKPISRPYRPDGAKDLPLLWNRTESDIEGRATDYLSKPKALLFTHIPLPEMDDPIDKDEQGNELRFGERRETLSLEGAQKNAGIFGDFQQRAQEQAGQGGDDQPEVVAWLFGHMHNNYDSRRIKKSWLCFNGGSSFAGYGDPQIERRARVLHVTSWGEQVETWSRLEQTQGRFDERILYREKGRA